MLFRSSKIQWCASRANVHLERNGLWSGRHCCRRVSRVGQNACQIHRVRTLSQQGANRARFLGTRRRIHYAVWHPLYRQSQRRVVSDARYERRNAVRCRLLDDHCASRIAQYPSTTRNDVAMTARPRWGVGFFQLSRIDTESARIVTSFRARRACAEGRTVAALGARRVRAERRIWCRLWLPPR